MYKLLKDLVSGNVHGVFKISDNTCIPMNPANIDYQEYLKWVSEGNTPLPADE